MAHTRLLVTTLLALGFAGASACTNGSGPTAPTNPGNPGQQQPSNPTYQPPAAGVKEPAGGGNEPTVGGQEPGTTGVEPTGAGNEPPGGGYEPPGGGTGRSGGTGGGASCLTCGSYSCVISYQGFSGPISVTLTPATGVQGACVAAVSGEILACGGIVIGAVGEDGGTTTGTWQASGLGGFTESDNGTTAVCTPSS